MPLRGNGPQIVEEVIHGVTVRDPYRWLEHRDRPETQEWLQAEKQICDRYFVQCGDLMAIRSRLHQYLDVDVVDQPAKVAGRYFYRLRRCGREQGCIETEELSTGKARLLVDPSKYGHFVSAGILRISDDGALLAYELRRGGADRVSVHIVDVDSGKTFVDHLPSGYIRGFAFVPGGGGFYYCHDRSLTESEHTIRLHLFHESVADRVVFRAARSRESRLVLTADHARLGAIRTSWNDHTFEMDFWIAKYDEPENWRLIVGKATSIHPFLRGGRILALTYENAANGKIVELTEDWDELRTVIPEQSQVIRQLAIVGDRAFASYQGDSGCSIRCWSATGREEPGIPVPAYGTVQLLPSRVTDERVIFYSYESFEERPALFEFDPEATRSKLWPRGLAEPKRHPLSIQHRTYESKDGAHIPITLVRRGDRRPSPACIMTSYGGFGVPSTPQFSVMVSIMLDLGAILALPHIRGGGEFGDAWHEAGR
ncbi:MAG: hypothetical protein WA634_20555, partial [Silvibacterium sp.]